MVWVGASVFLEIHMDNDGYPANTELKKIEKWPHTDLEGLLKYVRERWQYADMGYWRQRGGKYWVSTAGWSGNESMLYALQKNYVFWAMCWVQARRGGHYIFELKKPKGKNDSRRRKQKTTRAPVA